MPRKITLHMKTEYVPHLLPFVLISVATTTVQGQGEVNYFYAHFVGEELRLEELNLSSDFMQLEGWNCTRPSRHRT